MQEIELTYLVRRLPDGLKDAPSKEMLDIYIPASAPHPILRIRRSGERHEMTKKEPTGPDHSVQLEQTIPLTAEEFAELEQIPGKRVEKTRFVLDEGGVQYEIDVFRGDLRGLVLVDVEFPSTEARDAFQPPDWVLAEVTQEDFIAGGMLCGKAYTDIAQKLSQFQYQALG